MKRYIPIIFLLLCLSSFEAMFVYYIEVLEVPWGVGVPDFNYAEYVEAVSRFTAVLKLAIAINLLVSVLILSVGLQRIEAVISFSTLIYGFVLFSNLAALLGLCSLTFHVC